MHYPERVYLGERRKSFKLNEESFRADGGEARIFKIPVKGLCLRILKRPDDPAYQTEETRAAAEERLVAYQTKVLDFPLNLPDNVMVPLEPVYDAREGGQVIGHSMRWLRHAFPLEDLFDMRGNVRKKLSHKQITRLFLDIYDTMQVLHERGIVIGDWNPFNFLLRREQGDLQVYFSDTMTYKFGKYNCQSFMPEWIDPQVARLTGDPQNPLRKIDDFTPDTDWYSFWVAVTQGFLGVHPYHGIYRPEAGERQLSNLERPYRRISIFNEHVDYPFGAIPWQVLPDRTIRHLHGVFERDLRGYNPREVLEEMSWKKCRTCQRKKRPTTQHARKKCPGCKSSSVSFRGTETLPATFELKEEFHCDGTLMTVAPEIVEALHPACVYFEGDTYYREDGEAIYKATGTELCRFTVAGDNTLFSVDDDSFLHRPGQKRTRIPAESYMGRTPAVASNNRHMYWCRNGSLWRNSESKPVALADVLPQRTLIWSGPRFGFGFFETSHFRRGFLFDAVEPGEIPVDMRGLSGQIVDMRCLFTHSYLWLLIATRFEGQVHHACKLFDRNGKQIANHHALANDGSWLANLNGIAPYARPSTRPGREVPTLLAYTEKGMVQIEAVQGNLNEVFHFEGEFNPLCQGAPLIVTSNGCYTHDRTRICRLAPATPLLGDVTLEDPSHVWWI